MVIYRHLELFIQESFYIGINFTSAILLQRVHALCLLLVLRASSRQLFIVGIFSHLSLHTSDINYFRDTEGQNFIIF